MLWTPLVALAECAPGTYGSNCLQACRGHCEGENPCSRYDGTCLNALCSAGWNSSMCDQRTYTNNLYRASTNMYTDPDLAHQSSSYWFLMTEIS